MDTKEVIIQSAINLFSTKGYDGASVRDIASAAGVNVAMINYYFGSKEGLFESIVEFRASYLKGIFEELINNDSLSAIEKMDVIVDSTIERKFTGLAFQHLLHRELALSHRPQLKEAISDILLKNMNVVKKIIQTGINKGEFRVVDVELTLTTLLGTIHYLLTSDIMCRKILGKQKGFDPANSKKLKERLSIYTKKLLRDHLLK